jgi:hypothetical protein
MKLSDVDNTLEEGWKWDAVKSAGRGLRTLGDYASATLDKQERDAAGGIGNAVANKEAMRNYTKIAKGMVKMWQRKLKDLRDSGQFESVKSSILSGILLTEAPIRAKLNGVSYHKANDGKWYDEDNNVNTTDVPTLEKRAANQAKIDAQSIGNAKLNPKTPSTTTGGEQPPASPVNTDGSIDYDGPVQNTAPEDNTTTTATTNTNAELTKYKSVMGDWIGKVIGISDRSKIDKVLTDVQTTNPSDPNLLKAFIKALQLGASYSQELGTDGGPDTSKVGNLLKQISGVQPSAKAAAAVSKVLTPKKSQNEQQTAALIQALVKQLSNSQQPVNT